MNTSRLFRAPPRIAQHLRASRRYATRPTESAPPLPPNPTTATTPPPPPPLPKKEPSRVGAFYRNNTYPVLKSFLLALFTYQLAYYVWLKLEVVEEKSERQGTLRGLEEEVKKAVAQQKRNALDAAEEVAKGGDVKPEEKRSSRWSW